MLGRDVGVARGLAPQRRLELIDWAVARVRRWGLAVPAIVAVEAQRPLWFVYGQLAHLVAPFADLFLGAGLATELAALLSDPESIELFLDRLEAAEGASR